MDRRFQSTRLTLNGVAVKVPVNCFRAVPKELGMT